MSKAKGRSIWWRIHAWAGLKLSLLLAAILATGTFATISTELDWLATPAMRVAPASTPHASWGQLAMSAQSALPESTIRSIVAPPNSRFAAEAWVEQPDGELMRIWLNPYNARVQGIGPWTNIQVMLCEIHRRLLLPNFIGIRLVSAFSLLLTVLVVTGLVSYRRFWRGFFRWPKRRRGNNRQLLGDVHRLLGLWSLWFVALIAMTGFWYLIESLGADAPAASYTGKAVAQMQGFSQLDAQVAAAKAHNPLLEIREIRLPGRAGAPVAIMGQADAILVRDRANTVWIDPASNRVLDSIRGEDLSVHQRISEMADPLHFGTWGGLSTKLLWFCFGLMLTGLSVAGIIVSSLRLHREACAGRQDSSSGLGRVWLQGMGPWAYPALALLTFVGVLVIGYLVGLAPSAAIEW
ncbi:peptidase [Aurantiacibacter xanthus]|uniref:Peptidase n=1 Tax=Aurantiacibacter xanthus TaxID=1784712 RepID=A0A3A1P4T3_9SPHN|nr:PepSY-associated TM helix domain-containing protein [Aurantiacibacter xanthus]RIV88167.1 peptidase [Aurantiacibacter xanthus]